MESVDTQERIRGEIQSRPVVLFMKGTPDFPQCGFSSRAVQILHACGVEEFHSINVLEDPEIREGIKHYANWPTIPLEMYQTGELQKVLGG